MAALRERVVLAEILLQIDLDEKGRFRLKYGELVEYSNGVKRVRGRRSPYTFRSVEQLRYDFERDVEAA